MDGRNSFVFSWNKKHRPIHEEALKHFFDPSKNGEKFEYQLSANPDPPSQARRVTPAETIPSKAEENKCSSGIRKISQEKGTFFCYFTLFYCIFPRQDGRSRSVRFRPVETSLSMHLWISFEYMFVVVQFYSWFRFYYPFLRIEMYDNEFKTKGN